MPTLLPAPFNQLQQAYHSWDSEAKQISNNGTTVSVKLLKHTMKKSPNKMPNQVKMHLKKQKNKTISYRVITTNFTRAIWYPMN